MGPSSTTSRYWSSDAQVQSRLRQRQGRRRSPAKDARAEKEPEKKTKRRCRRGQLKAQHSKAISACIIEGQAILSIADRISNGIEQMSSTLKQFRLTLLNIPPPVRPKKRPKKSQSMASPYFFRVVTLGPTMSPFVQGVLRHEGTTVDATTAGGHKTKNLTSKTQAGSTLCVDSFSAVPTPCGLAFELQPSYFGLIQERIRADLFALMVQAILWNQTTAQAGRPVLFRFLCTFPTAQSLAVAEMQEVLAIIKVLGLQNKRSNVLIKAAQMRVASPPSPSRRYGKRNYPAMGDNLTVKDGELLSIGDPRPGWEIGHLPGIGPYAIDSFRIFYRDTLRGVEGSDGLEPEWKQEGWNWDMMTGQRSRIGETRMHPLEKNALSPPLG